MPSVDSGVICCRESGRWSCALFIFARFDLCVICVLDLMFCRCHDSCQGRVFSHFLCLGANPNTNGADRFGFHLSWSGLRRGVALSGSVSCFRIFSAPDVLVAGPGILASDHYLFRERRLQESSESEGMLFARNVQVHEIKSACGRCCFYGRFMLQTRKFRFGGCVDSGQLLARKIRRLWFSMRCRISSPRMHFHISRSNDVRFKSRRMTNIQSRYCS